MALLINNITKKYGENTILENISLELESGKLTAILGASGCGKTTLLRIIAGLIEHEAGEIILDGKNLNGLSAQNRNSVMVFQSYALFPHMTVEENVGYGLKVRKISKEERKIMVNEILKKVDLQEYATRKIQQLSGGQKQRVALARALVVKPNILLFDEPLSNLDENLRVAMRQQIRKIQKEFGITSLYVTHDQEEALSIADNIIVMDKGEIMQVGTPHDLYNNPKNEFVANFIGKANILESTIKDIKEDEATVTIFGNPKTVKLKNKAGYKVNDKVKIAIRPEEIFFDETGEECTIKWIERLGGVNRYTVECRGNELIIDALNSSGWSNIEIEEKAYINIGRATILEG